MAVKIELKRSAVPGKVPTVDQLDLGELAVNTYDGAIYFKQDTTVSQSIIQVATTAGSGSTVVSASHADFADLAGQAISSSFATFAATALSSSFAVSASYARSSSFATFAATSSNALSSSYTVSSSYATSASSADNANTASSADNFLIRGTLTGQDAVFNSNITASNALFTGTVTAQTLHVQTISSSVIYSSGSNVFGNELTDRQQFTGSVTITGSLSVNGDSVITSSSYSTFSSSIAERATNLESTASVLVQASASFSASIQLLSSSFLAFSQSYNTASFLGQFTGSFSGSLNNLQGQASYVPYFSASQVLVTSSIWQMPGRPYVVINQTNVDNTAPEALYVWQASTSSYNVISGKGNLNSYLQLNIQNLNNGVNASSDVVATANNGDETTNYIDMGINGANFVGPIGNANDAYLYSTGNSLHIGNVTPESIQFFISGTNVDNSKVLELNYGGKHNITGSLTVSQGVTASLFGTASWAVSASHARSALTSSYAISASFAVSSSVAVSASYGVSASFATTSSYALSSSLSVSSSYAVSASYAESSSQSQTASYAFEAVSASYAISSSRSELAGQAISSSYAVSASYAESSSAALQAISSSYAVSSSNSISSSYAISASYAVSSSNSISSSYAISSSYSISSSNAESASYAISASSSVSASYGISSSYAESGSYTVTSSYAVSASYSISSSNAISSSYAKSSSFSISASYAVSSSNSISSSYAITASYAISSSHAISSSYAGSASNAVSSSYATTASNALLLNGTSSATFANTGSNNFVGTQQVSGAVRFRPTQDPDPSGTILPDTFLFVSASNTDLKNDLYFRQDGNLVKWKWVEGQLQTGLLYGGALSYSGSQIYVNSGSGIIVNYNASAGSEVSPIVQYVNWGPITASATYLTSSTQTYVFIDDTATLRQQTTWFTPDQYQTAIPLGVFYHGNRLNITSTSGDVATVYNTSNQAFDFIRAFGPLKLEGCTVTPISASLGFSVGAGISYILGGFYQQDLNNISHYNNSAYPTASVARWYRSGSSGQFIIDNNGGSFYTSIDNQRWDNGTGTLATVGNNKWTIQRAFLNPITGRVAVYYGQKIYDSLADAQSNLVSDPFTEGALTAHNNVFVAYLIVEGNASNTDLTNTTANAVVQSGLFRNTAGSSGGTTFTTTLDSLSDVTITAPNNGQALIYEGGLWINGTPKNALTASIATQAISASFAVNAINAITANTANTATSASFATFANNALQASSASLANTALSATQSISASFATTALNAINATTASYVLNAVSASRAITSSFAFSASVAVSSSNAVSSSFAVSASLSVSSSNAISSSFATSASNSTSSSFALTASFALNVPQTSSFAISASYAVSASSTENAVYTIGDQFVDGTKTFGRSTYFNNHVVVEGTGSSGYSVGFKQYNNLSYVGPGYTSIGAIGTNRFTLNFNQTGLNYRNIEFDVSTLTLNTIRSFRFPDKTGTLLIDDITTGSVATSSLSLNAVSSSYALTASYALNAGSGGGGGISAIYIADEGVLQGTASYFDFTGPGVSTTVNAGTASISISGGGGSAIQGASQVFTQSLSATTWSFVHSINSRTPVVEVYDSSFQVIIPTRIFNPGPFNTSIFFDVPQSGYAIISTGGALAVTGSNAILDQTVAATTWSFNHNLGTQYPVFTIYDSGNRVIIPQEIRALTTASAEIYFSTPRTGKAVAALGGTSTFVSQSLSSSFAVSSSYAITSSLALTASVAVTASNAISASYAQSASVAAGTFRIGGAQSAYAAVNSSFVGSNNLFTLATGSFTGGFFKYTAYSASNARSGEVIAVWNGGNVQFTDYSTLDIGSTSALTMSVAIITSQVQFNAQTNTSDWVIKSQATFM